MLPVCPAIGHSARRFGSLSGVQLRWPHRLKICVPIAEQFALQSMAAAQAALGLFVSIRG